METNIKLQQFQHNAMGKQQKKYINSIETNIKNKKKNFLFILHMKRLWVDFFYFNILQVIP